MLEVHLTNQIQEVLRYEKFPSNEFNKLTQNCEIPIKYLFIFFSFFKDDEFHDIIKSSERIEFLYSHLFDEVIINSDLSSAFEQLLRIVHRVESDPLWVPASWVQ